MADLSKIDFADWFAVVVGGMVSGVGAAMAWFSSSKRRMHDRLSAMDCVMAGWNDRHAKHTTDIAVIQTCQESTAKQLDAIGITTRDTNENLKELSQTITQVLLAIQAKK